MVSYNGTFFVTGTATKGCFLKIAVTNLRKYEEKLLIILANSLVFHFIS